MGIVEPTNPDVHGLKGLHLYHSGRSNCSARVRLLLEEKQLDWTSHHIDLLKKGNSQAPCPIGLRGFVPSEPCDDLRW